MSRAFLPLVLLVCACGTAPRVPAETPPVLPGAEGCGVDTRAGRGGALHRVTNLRARGPGSLRACVEGHAPRVCIFETAGTIRVDSNLIVRNPYLTIAGQTAPSPGITIRGGGLMIRTHDVVVQHLRIRVGDDPDGAGGPQPCCRDGLGIQSIRADGFPQVYNVVVDHVSVSWAVDENVEIYGPGVHDVTIRNSIISEGLHASIHKKGPHSMGLLAGGARSVALIGNLFAHNGARNPKFTGGTTSIFANNLVYGWGTQPSIWSGQQSEVPTRTSIVGNVWIPGPTTILDAYRAPVVFSGSIRPGSQAFVSDNIWVGRSLADPWQIVHRKTSVDLRVDGPPVECDPLTILPSSDVASAVLTGAGARPLDRDAVDARIVRDVENTTCRLVGPAGSRCIIDTPHEVGGWPALRPRTARLAPPADANGDANGNGYTNLEDWLHEKSAALEP